MKILVVFDSDLNLESFDHVSIKQGDSVLLFPLTSSAATIKNITDRIKSMSCDITTVHSVGMIDEAADRLRNKYIDFIGDLSNFSLKNGSKIKDFFSIEGQTSLWWLSTVAEKNTLKCDSFSRLAQLDAIIHLISKEDIKKIYFQCKSEKLKEALQEYTKSTSILFEAFPVKRMANPKVHIREFQKFLYMKNILHLILFFLCFFMRTRKIKKGPGKLKRRPLSDDSMTIVTYYPYFDIPSAKKGVFRNKYYSGIQEVYESYGKAIAWVCINVQYIEIPFDKSLEYAEQFIKEGQILYFLEEFTSYASMLKILLYALWIGIKFKLIEKEIAPLHTFGTYNFYHIFRADWYSSFIGPIGFEGILYYNMFKSMLIQKNKGKILYLCEMHAWEKALIDARNATQRDVQLFGYQHGAVPWMLLNYFNSSNEINDDSKFSLPKPDMIICNGKLTYEYLKDCTWPEAKLSVAEAIRYKHLMDRNVESRNSDKDILLIVLSIHLESSNVLLNMAYDAIKNFTGLEVWVKPHPFMNMEDVDRIWEREENVNNFKIKLDPIEQLLPQAKILIVDESSVSIEALAYGCAVIIANMAETLNMSPLRNIKAEMIKTASSVQELKDMVDNILKMESYDRKNWQEEGKRIVNDFFCLNFQSGTPDKLLNILEA